MKFKQKCNPNFHIPCISLSRFVENFTQNELSKKITEHLLNANKSRPGIIQQKITFI